MIGGDVLAIIVLVLIFVLAFELWVAARFIRQLWNSPLIRSLLLTGIAALVILPRMGTDLTALKVIELGLVAGLPLASWMEFREVRRVRTQAPAGRDVEAPSCPKVAGAEKSDSGFAERSSGQESEENHPAGRNPEPPS